jgi:hypothetical protein
MRIHTALMWFDNSPHVPFAEKVQQAAAAYEGKFGRHPNVCYANPLDLPDGETQPLRVTPGLLVEAEPSVLRHHLFVGIAGRP